MGRLDDYTYSVETEYKSVREYKALHWTTEPPTVEGWYWTRGTMYYEKDEPAIVEYLGDNEVRTSGRDDGLDISYITHWLGPIPTPEPPTESE